MNYGPISRILLRVIVGILIAKGYFAPEQISWLTENPDVLTFVNMGVGFAIWAATEIYYMLAKRFGWPT